jgi:CBS domain-containing protein
VSKLIDEILPLHRQTSFPVAINKRLHGILALEDLKTLPRERWRVTRAREVMRPIGPRFFVEPSATLEYAKELMKRNGVGSLAVVNNEGDLVGFIQSGRLRRR